MPLPQLLSAVGGRFGAHKIFPLFPHAGRAASRILLQGRKGARTATSLLPGLVLHEENGQFTPQADQMLRHGAPLIIDEMR